MKNELSITCVSWIDQTPLPKVGFWMLAGASVNWAKRVIMGLVGTSNPAPGSEMKDVRAFALKKQYRALMSCVVQILPEVKVKDVILDPGYTPPFDKTKIDTAFSMVAPIPDDPDFHAGEKSPVSNIYVGRLHPSSTLSLKREYKVLVSGLIKFRAGGHTDRIGIEKANSPVHVPWVWSEFTLVSVGGKYRLLVSGSVFPSHAWYVNGKKISTAMQATVTVSEHDPILNTGQPANKVQTSANTDKDSGAVSKQANSIGGGKQFDIEIVPASH
ncbi:MAG: hypothetical protein Q7V20_07290 [Aquabacterium sp.]|uniref:hypothetical protein n=1 Tax=Aquabacterium sp. TaxID=1872578 RepID=UPI002726CADC|nr:hypothetical protein [Aquabacterium sp.]MDO9003239.1 hypothetical protein [Aquabacterium sp.]